MNTRNPKIEILKNLISRKIASKSKLIGKHICYVFFLKSSWSHDRCFIAFTSFQDIIFFRGQLEKTFLECGYTSDIWDCAFIEISHEIWVFLDILLQLQWKVKKSVPLFVEVIWDESLSTTSTTAFND